MVEMLGVKRTRKAIRCRAMLLGVRLDIKVWTAAEDEILRQRYADEGSHALAGELKATPVQIRKHAQVLGLRSNRPPAVLVREQSWTKEEVEYLRSRYAIDGALAVAKATGRSRDAVYKQATKQGIRQAGKAHTSEPKKTIQRHENLRALTIMPAKQKAKASIFFGDALITKDTKVTIAPPFVDRRWSVDNPARVVDSADCREWAKQAA